MQATEFIQNLIKKGILVNKDVFYLNIDFTQEIFDKIVQSNIFVLDKETLLDIISGKNGEQVSLKNSMPESENYSIIFNYTKPSFKREISHFVSYFEKRYLALKKILSQRKELENVTSINRILSKKEKENVSVIGLVLEKQITKNGNIILTLEDKTGMIKVMISKNKQELYKEAKDIVLDEVIGVVGTNSENIIFANNILWPDIPLTKEMKKSPDECYALFISDTHVGNKKFLKEEFERFIEWLHGKTGNDEQKAISQKVRYLFITGDLVEGAGYYPDQEQELEIPDIIGQYSKLAEYLDRIPKYINIFIVPGDHDAMRIAEPQAPLYEDFANELYKIKNLKILSNPAFVNIHSSQNFPGFDVLLYHGYSFIYYATNVSSIYESGGIKRADLVMKFLLKRRHLSPTHAASLYLPDYETDPLVIEKVPDIFASGHIHQVTVKNYKNITLLNSSCWLPQTDYQEARGIMPHSARVLCLNLQTRETKVLRF